MKDSIKWLFLLITTLSYQATYSSSAVSIKGNLILLAKNYDSENSNGMLIKNNRGITKTAYGLENQKLVSWTSKYGSITFNQLGKEFPTGGMNERGLVIEMLTNEEAFYPENAKYTLNEYEWVQYNLDNYKTAAEVIYFLDSIDINPLHAKVHYIITDRGGRNFVIEFLNGKAIIHKSDENFQVLTNHNYEFSEQYYQQNKKKIDNNSEASLDRYAQLRSKIQQNQSLSNSMFFKLMEGSTQKASANKTQWTVIYDPFEYQLFYYSKLKPSIKSISLKAIDFGSLSTIVGMNVHTNNIYWEKYTASKNLALLENNESVLSMVNLEKLNHHMMQPNDSFIDSKYANYSDLTLAFNTKKTSGKLYYFIIANKYDYCELKPIETGVLSLNDKKPTAMVYSMLNQEYAIITFHSDEFINDWTLMDLKEADGFSMKSKGWFGPPKFEQIKFNLEKTKTVEIKF